MRYQANSLQSDLKPEDVLAFVQKEVSNFNDFVDLDDGLYSILGDFAIYLRDSIAQGVISELDLKSAFKVMNHMGESEDLEVQNLLVVAIFEILADIDDVIEIVKKGLVGNASELFRKVISGWD